MKWVYKHVEEQYLRKECRWQQDTLYVPHISCLTGKLILPFTKCMHATWYYKVDLGMTVSRDDYWCTTKEFVLWSLIKGE